MKKIYFWALALGLMALASLTAAADEKEKQEFTVVKENPVTPVKNQYRSGTCWCFSALSFVESEILRTKGIEADLSELYVVGKSYHDRAEKYIRLDGFLNFAAGSSFGDVFHVIRDYGIVPESEMPGLTELPDHFEMDSALKGYVESLVASKKGLTARWSGAFDSLLDSYLGKSPETFTVDGKEYDPKSYRDMLGINPDDYVNLTSFSHKPFYEPFIIEVPDNWRWDSAWNIPIDELMDVMKSAIAAGYTIAWGSDVSEKGFSRDGLAIIPEADEPDTVGSDQEHWVGKDSSKTKETSREEDKSFKVTQEMRQEAYDNKTTTDDHGMHIYGLAKDRNGADYFMVKNSWGKAGAYEGIWYASETFVKYKTLNVVMHKDALPKDLRKKLGIR